MHKITMTNGKISSVSIPNHVLVHYLKLQDRYFMSAKNFEKNFEIRKADRNYRIGHYLRMDEFSEGYYTGRRPIFRKIKYMSCYNQIEDFVVLGLEKVSTDDENFMDLVRLYPDLLKPMEREVYIIKQRGN